MYSFLYAVNLRRVGLDVEYRRSVKGIEASHDEPGGVNAEKIYHCKSNRVRASGWKILHALFVNEAGSP